MRHRDHRRRERMALGYGRISWLRQFKLIAKHMVKSWWAWAFGKRKKQPVITKVETNIFDKEEIYENCTVQVLTNTKTGEVSVGWWKNEGGKQ